MNRTLSIALMTAAGIVLTASQVQAQVFVRAPFVRVQVGGPGVYVRAPFVSLYAPRSEPYYVPTRIYSSSSPAPIQVMPPAELLPAPRPVNAPPPGELLPPPKKVVDPQPENPDLTPPVPLRAVEAPTLPEFAKSFQPKAGSFEVMIQSPVTKEPTTVRFTLPEGKPKNVQVNDRSIEYRYGPLRFVRIEFDKDGALVTSR